ncbi:hypothetical protein ACNKHS_13610 [Shigella flexneri]
MKSITLFSPSRRSRPVRRILHRESDEFERLYTKYRKDDSIRKQRVKAVECLLPDDVGRYACTGRIYIQNVDHCNTHSPFDPVVAPVRQSNLSWRSPCRPNRWTM